MTDYVEQMMKTAGVNLLPLDCEKCGAQRFALGQCANTDCKRIYPDFTAEKQLELIKLVGKSICQNNYTLELETDEIEKFYILSLITQRSRIREFNVFGTDFSQVFAQLATELIKRDKLDKEKVKEILQ